VPQPADARTGRPVHVSGLAAVSSRDGALRVIKQMQDDLADASAGESGNPNLERFLHNLHGFLADLDGYHANRGRQPPAQSDWNLFATALAAAAGYE
jgi:tRNA A37 threonylcarbamoyladenosine synthetase subunit TsaC/SUA5/YrdC